MRRRRGIMGLNGGAGIPIITATATGNPLSFVTDLVRPLKSLEIPFTPIQAAGTPSPDNPLPISGWTGCKITHTHGNLIDPSTSTFGSYINNSGEYVASAINPKLNASDFFRVVPGHQYTMHMENQNGATNKIVFCWYSSDKRFLRRGVLTPVNNHPYYTLTQVAPSDAYYGRANYFTSNLQTALIYDSTELIETPDSQVVALPITFTDPSTGDPLAVYGGTLTLNEDGSADLVEDWYHFIVNGDTNKATSSSAAKVGDVAYRRYNKYLNETAKNIIGTQWLSSSVMCDGCKVAKTVASGAGEEMFVYPNFNYWYVYIREDALAGTTAADFNAYMREHPIAISAKAKSGYSTPNTYHFDNIGQLITFVGTNNIWTDTNGTNTATYLKHQS